MNLQRIGGNVAMTVNKKKLQSEKNSKREENI